MFAITFVFSFTPVFIYFLLFAAMLAFLITMVATGRDHDCAARAGILIFSIPFIPTGIFSVLSMTVHERGLVEFSNGHAIVQEEPTFRTSPSNIIQAGEFQATKIFGDSCDLMMEVGWRETDATTYEKIEYPAIREGETVFLPPGVRVIENNKCPVWHRVSEY